ncbi:MAG: LysM peptidoglycan-binding domain-containing protein [Spirochaetaceae bacterium]|jgi:hypothetical protein|nr:LysM peptidoglycan-binding domain-containing protein [Spirochaetaceae bacterium]
MDKVLRGAAALFFVLIALSCKSSPTQTENAENTEAELLAIYGNYNRINLEGAEEYVVKDGDTLTGIAREFYGEDGGYYFPLIMFASQSIAADPDKIAVDPDKIEPGQILIIPDLQNNLDYMESRLQLKAMLLDVAFVYEDKADKASGLLKERFRKDRVGLVELSRTL